MSFKPRVFSGMQPTGNLHLGNYLGALTRWVEMQSTHDCIYCIVDMHSITAQWIDPNELRQSIRDVTAAYLAAGLDPKKSILFNQSQVPEHAELAWIFNCTARLGWLDRMTQFKDKAGKDKERASVGLYAYPVLMAADILVYQATHVPVGDDQKQHLELARDIAQKFNSDYRAAIVASGYADGQFFPLCEPVIMGPATRVMSLRDGTKKMSKSDVSDLSRINMTDDADTIAKKIQKAKTDADALPSEEAGLKGRPEADNLVGIYAALSQSDKQGVLRQYGGGQFSAFKKALAELAVEKISPVNVAMRQYLADPAEIDRILKQGGERARAVAQPIMRKVKDIVGFLHA
jgi:tryptophanyl-tRNA synthetase